MPINIAKVYIKTISGKLVAAAQHINPYSSMLLGGLQSKPMYDGGKGGPGYKTPTVLKRRARNKRAHHQRMINAHK